MAAGAVRSNFRRIDGAAVHETIVRLEKRIGTNFPDSGLRRVAQELVTVAAQAAERAEELGRRSPIVQIIASVLAGAIVAILLTIPFTLRFGDITTTADAIQVLEAALSASFFIGAVIIFLLSFETRLRRKRVLGALHEMRAFAHVVDMHQLTKDVFLLLRSGSESVEFSRRPFNASELQRYLEYCTEMLALISKLAALYVQDFPDSDAVLVVDDVEELTAGLARKIWQKMILIPRDGDDKSPLSAKVTPSTETTLP